MTTASLDHYRVCSESVDRTWTTERVPGSHHIEPARSGDIGATVPT